MRTQPKHQVNDRVSYRPLSYGGTLRGVQGTVTFVNVGVKGQTETSYSVAWDIRHPGLPGIVREQHIEGQQS